MKTPMITDAQIHSAEKLGVKWNIGQLTKAEVSELNRRVRRGELVKVIAMWPYFSSGTVKKTCYLTVE